MPAMLDRLRKARSVKRLVVVESPFAGDRERNAAYLRDAMRDSLERGEAPYASHLIYTQVLDDDVPEERALGIEAGFAWGQQATLVAVYADLGLSHGMRLGIEAASRRRTPVVFRSLPSWSDGRTTETFERVRADLREKIVRRSPLCRPVAHEVLDCAITDIDPETLTGRNPATIARRIRPQMERAIRLEAAREAVAGVRTVAHSRSVNLDKVREVQVLVEWARGGLAQFPDLADEDVSWTAIRNWEDLVENAVMDTLKTLGR